MSAKMLSKGEGSGNFISVQSVRCDSRQPPDKIAEIDVDASKPAFVDHADRKASRLFIAAELHRKPRVAPSDLGQVANLRHHDPAFCEVSPAGLSRCVMIHPW